MKIDQKNRTIYLVFQMQLTFNFLKDSNDQKEVLFSWDFEKKKLWAIAIFKVTTKPIAFHQSQDTLTKYIQQYKLNKNPQIIPIQALLPLIFFVNIPNVNTPIIGPLIKEPILLIAIRTLLEISST